MVNFFSNFASVIASMVGVLFAFLISKTINNENEQKTLFSSIDKELMKLEKNQKIIEIKGLSVACCEWREMDIVKKYKEKMEENYMNEEEFFIKYNCFHLNRFEIIPRLKEIKEAFLDEKKESINNLIRTIPKKDLVNFMNGLKEGIPENLFLIEEYSDITKLNFYRDILKQINEEELKKIGTIEFNKDKLKYFGKKDIVDEIIWGTLEKIKKEEELKEKLKEKLKETSEEKECLQEMVRSMNRIVGAIPKMPHSYLSAVREAAGRLNDIRGIKPELLNLGISSAQKAAMGIYASECVETELSKDIWNIGKLDSLQLGTSSHYERENIIKELLVEVDVSNFLLTKYSEELKNIEKEEKTLKKYLVSILVIFLLGVIYPLSYTKYESGEELDYSIYQNFFTELFTTSGFFLLILAVFVVYFIISIWRTAHTKNEVNQTIEKIEKKKKDVVENSCIISAYYEFEKIKKNYE